MSKWHIKHVYECQAAFYRHVTESGLEQVSVNPCFPRLIGEAERSHQTEDSKCDQFLINADDVDLSQRLRDMEDQYSFHRPHESLNGKAPTTSRKSNLLTDDCRLPKYDTSQTLV